MLDDVEAPVIRRILALPETKAFWTEIAAIGEPFVKALEHGAADALLVVRAHVPLLAPKSKALLSAIIVYEITKTLTTADSPISEMVVGIGDSIITPLVVAVELELGRYLEALAREVKGGCLRALFRCE